MTGTVNASFIAGEKTFDPNDASSRTKLNQICDLLGVKKKVKDNLPIGKTCTYQLVLSSGAKVPSECTVADE